MCLFQFNLESLCSPRYVQSVEYSIFLLFIFIKCFGLIRDFVKWMTTVFCSLNFSPAVSPQATSLSKILCNICELGSIIPVYKVLFFFSVFLSALTLRTWGDPPGVIPWWTLTTPGTGAPLSPGLLCVPACLVHGRPGRASLSRRH